MKPANALLVSVFLSLVICLASANAQTQSATNAEAGNFLAFWNKFKSAVISGDKATVAKMTKFPLSMPYLIKPVRNEQELLRRYDEVFKGEANAAQCFGSAKPEKESTRYEVYCPFKATPSDKENAPIRFAFELTKSGWKFAGLDNINE